MFIFLSTGTGAKFSVDKDMLYESMEVVLCKRNFRWNTRSEHKIETIQVSNPNWSRLSPTVLSDFSQARRIVSRACPSSKPEASDI